MNIFTVSGDLLRISASSVLLLDLHSTQSSSGLSRKSLELSLLACALKYLDLLIFFVGFYNWLMKVAFVTLAAVPVYWMRTSKPHKSSYDAHLDTLPTRQLFLPCFLLSLIFNQAFNLVDILYSFAAWLEVVSLLPQLSLSCKVPDQREVLKQWSTLWALSRLLYVLSFVYRIFGEGATVNKIAVVASVGQMVIAGKLAMEVMRKREKTDVKSE